MPMFTKAHSSSKRLRMALEGPGGCGKTYTALVIARALGDRIALIDTERGGASYYADRFDFDTVELHSFHPEKYIEALTAAAVEGYQVVIIDSLSHAWFGKDGALELVDRAAKKSEAKNSYFAWREVTPLHNRLVDALVQAPFHVIVTLRTKTDYIMELDNRGKQVPKKVGLAPIQREGLEYEFDVVGDISLDHTLTITKSRLFTLADLVVERPGPAFGQQVHEALTQSSAEQVDHLTGEILPLKHATAESALQEIGFKLRNIVRPLAHAGLLNAVVHQSFGLDKPSELKSLSLATLEVGLPLFRHLCAELHAHGKPEILPHLWIAEEQRKLAARAMTREEEDDTIPPGLAGSADGPSWGTGDPDLMKQEEEEASAQGIRTDTVEDLRDMPSGWLTRDEQRALAEHEAAEAHEQAGVSR